MKRIAPLLAVAALILIVLGYFLTARVPAGTVSVVDAGGGQRLVVLKPGFHFRPIGSKVVPYSTLAVSVDGEALLTPASGGEIPTGFTATCRLDPERAGDLHAALQGAPLEEFLEKKVAELLRGHAAGADAVEALTPQFRSRVAGEIETTLEQGGFAEASIAIKPPDHDTLLAAAQYLAPRREAWKIRQTVSEALREPDGPGSWKLLTAMGLVDESEGLFPQAEKSYLDALAIDPSAIPPMSELVSLHSTAKSWEKLLRILDAALTANPRSLQHINWTAVALLKVQDYVGAERILKSGLEIDPDNATLLANLGTLYMKMDRVEDALGLFRRAAETSPSNQQALFNLGSALAATGRFPDALPYLERAESAGPPTLPLITTLQIVYEKTGDKARAAAYKARAGAMEAEQRSARKPRPAPAGKGAAPSPPGGARNPS